ncbi:MAG: nucleoside deaminase [Fibrobacter sp.]|nr:nucleoside deaminase [Fibrobacter sp.]
MNHQFFMNAALQEAFKALDEGEVPVGAVVVKNGSIIGKGYNRVEKLTDATAHAEIIAMTAASNYLSNWRLTDCTMYVTLEPCLMCLGALLQSRIAHIVYATPDSRAGAIDSHYYRLEIERTYGYFPEITTNIMKDDCAHLLSSFFQNLRKKS